MDTSPGSRLDHYEIIEAIGKGGMGEVFRARDTRLPRDTAIKVSMERFGERFAREAQIIASLNHPNISTLYDVGPNYLVMELVEGPTLADQIRKGTLPLDEASAIARQIADALDYAHDKGVVHRDLKPGNIKIRPDGVVKVLDFGLAKVGGARGAMQSADSPTVTGRQTEAGMVLGTAAYMSPEQAKGHDVDKRADIWAFGCVFYEMLTGSPPHLGDTSQETMASILRDEPDLNKVPAQARRMLKRCLEKDPQKRLRHIGDVLALLDEPPSGQQPPALSSGVHAVAASNTKPTNWLVPSIAGAVVLIAGIGIAVWAPWRGQTAPEQAVRFEVGESDAMTFFYGGAMAVSPDGRWMVFPAISKDGVARYWVRSLETVEARELQGTETAYVPASWSSDSRFVLFSPLSSPQIKKVNIQGGPPQTLTEMPGRLNGAAENKDGVIIFASSLTNQPVFRVAASSGTRAPVTALSEGELAHRWPQFLPDGRHFLYLRVFTDSSKTGLFVGSLDAKPDDQNLQRVLATNRQAYYAASPGGGGHLIFLRDTTLMAQPFDLARFELNGNAAPIAEGVDSFPANTYGLFSVSNSGALVYRGGGGSTLMLTWYDDRGNPAGTVSDPGVYANLALSPDETRIAVAIGEAGGRDIWTVDVARRTNTRLTFDPGNDDNPIWSPDGKNVVFASNRTGRPRLYIKPADGSAEERLIGDQPGAPTSWSKDGRFLLFTSTSLKTGADLWVLPEPDRASGDTRAFSILATPFLEQQGQFSPDGRWIAYQSSESSGNDIYVRPFSPEPSAGGAGAKWLVSRGAGALPRWRSDGKGLFYGQLATFDIMSVDIDTRKGFQANTPRRLFTAPPPLLPGLAPAANDRRFLFVTTPNGGRLSPFTVVVNWAATLKK